MHWGKMKIQKLYQKDFKEEISSHKVQCVIKKYNLYPNKVRKDRIQAKRRRSIKKKRITELKIKLPYLGYLLHFDTITIHWNGMKRYIITMIDDFTKMAFARMYTNKSSRSAEDFLSRVNYLLDGRISKAHQDNGSEFQQYFTQLCGKLNIKQYYSRPHTPKDNPSVERFNQTLEYEWLKDGNFTPDVPLFNSRLKEFIIEYNSVRPHESLNYLSPIEFAVKYKQLSERYASCTFS
jgi:transposase InsO family protein